MSTSKKTNLIHHSKIHITVHKLSNQVLLHMHCLFIQMFTSFKDKFL